MKAYLGIKYHSDHRNKPKIEKISALLEQFDCSVICITRDIEKWGQNSFSPKDLMGKTFEVIDSCDIVIIDLSEKGVGLCIEAGYAYSKAKPLITIAENQEISTTLLGISNTIHVYKNESDLSEFFKDVLSSKT